MRVPRPLFRLPVAVLVAALVAATAASAQTALPGRETSAASVASYPLAQKMPVDPEVLVGALPNGLRFYVRPNGKPAKQAELRLVVKTGSALEDPDQLGLAHFVEHMEFEGTRNFPGQSIIDFLSSLGLSIGADANAATSYDDTQYTLRVPTDVPGVLDRALLVLRDWADGATFDQNGIDHERGIVLSEWRMRLGADDRTQDEIRRVQLEGTRYADRPPIGNPKIIESAQREQLVRFYRDWYRPDLMAVIVVGDVDRNDVAQMINRHFSSLTNPTPERPRPAFDVPDRSATRYAVITDKESTSTVVRLSTLRPARNQGTVGGYRAIMLDRLFADMLGSRLDELSQGASPPFLRAAADRSLFSSPRTRDEAVLQALVSNDGVARGLDALMTELQRIQRFGFTASELARAKEAMMLGSERVVAESPDRESESRADEYTRNFLEDEALPTIWHELAFHRRFDPGITLAEVNALALDWFPERDRLIVVSAPEASGVVLPTQTQLAEVVRAASAKRLEPYVDAIAGRKLMDAPPPRGSVAKTTVQADAGVTEWVLSNGATVVIKPTTLKEGQILFRATAPGGTSLASDQDFLSARIADTVVPASGIGSFSSVALDKLLNGKAVAVRPFIDDTRQGMSGGSTPQDIETMFQLIYLHFTQPRADPTAFAAMKSQATALLANQMASPDVVFEQTIDATLSQNHPRRQPETPTTAAQWNLEKAFAFYKARFADASNFTFVFVGSFTPESLKPLVETYIASLPATHSRESWRNLGITPPPGIVDKTIEKGIAPKSSVAIVFSGPFEYDDANKLALRAMILVLQSRLSDTIRQELGGTYSITANPDTDKFPTPTYTVRIDWTCDPARTASLVQRVLEEVSLVRGTLLTPDRVARVRDVLLREFDRNSQENGYLLNEIARRYDDGDGASVGAVVNLRDRIATLNGYAIQQAAQAYLDTSHYVQVTLLPEKP
jgi:zinc protease